MFSIIWNLYLYTILTAFLTTLGLLLSGYGWSVLPHYYLKLVTYLQSFFTEDGVVLASIERTPSDSHKWMFGRSNSTSSDKIAECSKNNREDPFDNACEPDMHNLADDAIMDEMAIPSVSKNSEGTVASPFEWNLELIRDGIESVIQDDISGIFGQSSAYRNAEPHSLRDLFFYYKRRRQLQKRDKLNKTQPVLAETNSNVGPLLSDDVKEEENLPPLKFRPFLRSCLLLLISRVFRGGILFPIRLALLISSFIFLIIACFITCFVDFSAQAKTKIAVIYCRLFTAGTGLIARYHNRNYQPIRPGIAVANHLSPNDIQIICADVDPNREYLYTVTGQKHKGIIWAIEHYVEKLCPSIWLERSCPGDRKNFTKAVIDVAKVSGPILIFPEGYCTNNEKVLQFRRAVFEEGVTIYPIAIKQNARFGDSFWSEDHFFHYLRRILTSWAIVYDVIYLPPQTRLQNESSTEFAARIQTLIADAARIECANFDGGLFYKALERQKYRKLWIEECGKRIMSIVNANPASYAPSISDSSSTDGTDDKFERCVITDNGVPEFLNMQENYAASASTHSIVDDADVLVTVYHIESDVSSTDHETECVSTNESHLRTLNNDMWVEEAVVEEPVDFRRRKATTPGVFGNKILQRRRYNSLHLLQRQISTDSDLNG